MTSNQFALNEWWHGLGPAERCGILVESGIPELVCFGLHLSRFELAELPAMARDIAKGAWMRFRFMELDDTTTVQQ